MQIRHHPLHAATPGTARELISLHFGTPGSGPKTTIQASLHADEVPAMLVAHHLRHGLARLEAEGRLAGEVVLVPVANPLGLSQRLLQQPIGRFDLASGENFNRHYADLVPAVLAQVEGRLGSDASANVALVRRALRGACAALPADSELASLRRTLLSLAADADTVLDLHCDNEAVLHLYTATPLWPQVAPLAQALQAELTLLATQSGDEPFDEACSMFWPRLSQALAERDPDAAVLPEACVAITVELRGEAQVDHTLAARDAQGLLDYLAWRGQIRPGTTSVADGQAEPGSHAGSAAPARARPLAGCMPVVAPHGGILIFLAELGSELRAGTALAELIDPLSGAVTTLACPVDGVFFARESRRFVAAGSRIAKVAGEAAVRRGKLLSA